MNQPWLAHYDEGVPHSIGTYPAQTIAGLMSRYAQTRPEDVAIRFKGRALTYAEIDAEAAALAAGLAQLGIYGRDRVALVLPNSPQFVIAALAVWRIGAIVHPLNPIYTEREMREALRAVQPDTVIVLTRFYDTIRKARVDTGVRHVIATNIKEYLPPHLRVLFTLLKEKKEGDRITIDTADLWLQDVIRRGREHPVRQIATRPDDPAAILMSGGTTGTPKGVLINQQNLVMSGTQIAAWLHEPLSVRDAAILLPLPLFHIYGMGTFATSVVSGVPLILIPNPREIADILASVERDRPSILAAVPTLLSAILNHPKVAAGRIDFTSVKACFSGAAALLAETKKRFEAATGSRIVEGYSLTESAMACCLNPFAGTNKIGSVGMPLPDVNVRILEPEEGLRELPIGATGEVVLTAPQLMQGYWNNAAETANAVRILSDGSLGLYTGDLGYLDEDGYLFLVDRKKDLIKTSGLQVWPREVEEVIAAHPAVLEVGVAGLPDERKGEIVGAWVVLRPGTTLTAGELRTWCKEKLAPFKIPTRIEFRSELPKTMIGKILRRALAAEANTATAPRPLAVR